MVYYAFYIYCLERSYPMCVVKADCLLKAYQIALAYANSKSARPLTNDDIVTGATYSSLERLQGWCPEFNKGTFPILS